MAKFDVSAGQNYTGWRTMSRTSGKGVDRRELRTNEKAIKVFGKKLKK